MASLIRWRFEKTLEGNKGVIYVKIQERTFYTENMASREKLIGIFKE